MLDVLSNAVEENVKVNPQTLSDGALECSLVERRQLIDQLCAAEAADLSEWDNRLLWKSDDSRSAGHRFARETGCSISTGKRLVRRAKRLRTMPGTSVAFASGRLSSDRVDLLCGINQPGVANLFAQSENALINAIDGLFFNDAVQLCRYWLFEADEANQTNKGKDRVYRRSWHASRTFEGTIDVRGLLDAIDGETYLAELERLEDIMFKADWAEAVDRLGNNDDVLPSDLRRTPTQRRADAMVEMAKRSAAMAPGSRKPKPLVTIVMGNEKFARMCETGEGTVLTPELVLPHLHEADIEHIVYDGNSRVIDVSRQRTFVGALRKAILIRDPHCTHPSQCDVRSSKNDIDHDLPFSKGGATVDENGNPMCPFHNRSKGSGPPTAA